MTIHLPELHAAQREMQESTARFRVCSAGRRFGKGVLGIGEGFRRGIEGKKCRFIAPTYASDSYQAAWNLATLYAKQIPGAIVHLQRRQIDFSVLGGEWLQFRTAEEPDSLRGEGIDFVVFDEAAHIPHLEEMWEQCVRPSLMDRSGDAWFISTPNGHNYFNDLFLRARDDPNWASFQFPTSANPFIAPEEVAALRATLPELVARQEVDASFVQLAGALFKRQNIRVIDEEPPGVSWVRSWDLAWTEKTTSDFTAGAKMALTRDGTVIIADVIQARMEWPDAVRTIADTARLDGRACRQGVEVVGAQEGALQTLLRDPLLVAHVFEPIKVNRDKLTRALPLVARSEQGKLAIVRGNWNQKFLDELCSFPEGQHDDMCLTSNTRVLCNHAWKPISEIRVGEKVRTRKGLRNVLWSGQTGMRNVITRFGITGTPNHPVWTENRGWTPLQSLNPSDELACVENPWFLTAEHFTDTQIQDIDQSRDIFTRTLAGFIRLLHFIARFGNSFTAQFRSASASITETVLTTIGFQRFVYATPSSTVDFTSAKLIRDQSTNANGSESAQSLKVWRRLFEREKREKQQHLSGKGFDGLSEDNRGGSVSASYAVQPMTNHRMEQPRHAMILAAQIASDIGLRNEQSAQADDCLVPVYNISIEGEHEFFANGILVHNCDACSGGMTLLSTPTGAITDPAAIRIGDSGPTRPMFAPRRLVAARL